MDFVTGFSRKPSSCSRSASSRTSSRPKAVTSTIAGRMSEGLVALDVPAGLEAVHAGHPPVHEDEVIWIGGVALLDRRDRLLPRSHRIDTFRDGAQPLLQDLARGGVVIDDEDAEPGKLLWNDPSVPVAAPTPSQTVK